MHALTSIPLRKLFIITLGLKLLTGGFGWWLSDPYIFGALLPLSIMVAYIALGSKRQDKTVSDERFADSCYYLGFMFTIVSIIFALIDLPNIGTKMVLIASRFGVAMVSTVIGLGVRVAIVSFRRDSVDALAQADQAVVDASDRLRDRLTLASDKLEDFHNLVDNAAQKTVASVELQLNEMAGKQGQQMATFLETLTVNHKSSAEAALEEIRTSSNRLAGSVDGYAAALGASLKTLEDKVGVFTTALTSRLSTTTFPDDYFATQLAGPLTQLRARTDEIAEHMSGVASEVKSANTVLTTALKSIKTKADTVAGSLDRVTALADTQAELTQSAKSQVVFMGAMTDKLTQVGETMRVLSETVSVSGEHSEKIATHAGAIAEETTRASKAASTTQEHLGTAAGHLPVLVAAFEQIGVQMTQMSATLQDSVLKTQEFIAQGKLLHDDHTASRELVGLAQTTADKTASQLPSLQDVIARMEGAMTSLGGLMAAMTQTLQASAEAAAAHAKGAALLATAPAVLPGESLPGRDQARADRPEALVSDARAA